MIPFGDLLQLFHVQGALYALLLVDDRLDL
jgi:hypothetical protein